MKQLTKILLLLIINFLLFINSGFAQNLVPNFGFEQYSSCPTTGDEVELCTGWSKFSNNISTPDYYNGCAASNTVGVPTSFYVYQQDHRNCGAYMGLVTRTSNPNEREHIGIQLNQPLVIGQKYFLSFYTVMGGSGDASIYYESPANNIGIRLSTVSYSSSNPVPIDNFSHLHSAAIISDTANWVRISGSIVADSAYNYLILGNFYDDANTDTTTLNCGICINNYSYYLIDDVCVSTDSLLCNGGIDVLPCTVSIEENSFENQINIYPNPANDFINIASKNQLSPLKITIYNTIGQTLYTKQNSTSNNLQIDISNYNSGLLFIKIESFNQSIIYKLFKS